MNPMTMLSRAQFHGAVRLATPRHRVYWVIAMLLLLWGALSNLSHMILRFVEAPTYLITTDIFSTLMPFPAVLICPEVLFQEKKVEELLATAKYPDGMDANSIRPIIAQLAAFFSPDVPFTLPELAKVQQFLEYNSLDVEEAGLLLTTSCEETLIRCRYQWIDLKCDEVFQMELTPYGFCCVFNGRSLKRELKLKNRVHKNNDYDTVMTSQVGPAFPLALVINQSQKQDNVDLSYKWAVVQSRHRFVDTAKNGTALSPGSEQWTRYWTRRLLVAEDLHFMSDKLRGCRIDNKQLNYFPVYNKKNCLVECQMRMTMQLCQCLLPVHFRPYGVPLCTAASLSCARNTLTVIFDKRYCDCPFTCDYEFEYTENSNYDMSMEAKPYDKFYQGLDLSKVSVLRVFLRSHKTASNVRRSYFSFHDLFSQLGGVFNVFFGCSVLTLMELLQLARHCLRYVKTKTEANLTIRTGKTTPKRREKTFVSLRCQLETGRVNKSKLTKKQIAFLHLKKSRGLQTLLNVKSSTDLRTSGCKKIDRQKISFIH